MERSGTGVSRSGGPWRSVTRNGPSVVSAGLPCGMSSAETDVRWPERNTVTIWPGETRNAGGAYAGPKSVWAYPPHEKSRAKTMHLNLIRLISVMENWPPQ
jgi:hypothetical protein